MATTETNRLRDVLDRFLGRRCIGCIPGAGSFVHLELEPRKPRQRPLTNPHLTEEQRQGVAEYGLFVYSVWRLDSPEAVICGAWDDNQADGPMLRGLERLVGETVTSCDLEEPGLDLVVRFSNGWAWRIFCDQVNDRDRRDNYNVFYPEGTWVVGTKSQLRHEAD